jgi:hypothetical protein
MRLIVSTFISLDGVLQAPGGPDEDVDGGFSRGELRAGPLLADETYLSHRRH